MRTTTEKKTKRTSTTKTAPRPAPLAGAGPSTAARAPRLIPRIGITVDRARAIAAHGQRLPWKDYGPSALAADGCVVLYQELAMLVALFTGGGFEGNVVAVTLESDPNAPALRQFVVRDMGVIEGGAYYDPIRFAETHGTCESPWNRLPLADEVAHVAA